MTLGQSVRVGDTIIDYRVCRSGRRKKTVQITVDGSGVRVAAPMATPEGQLRDIVRKRAPWILRHTSKATLEAPPQRVANGETLPYLGRNLRLIIEAGDAACAIVRFDHWSFRVQVPNPSEDGEGCRSFREALVRWYRDRAAERMESMVEVWWPRLGREGRPRVLIRDQRRRWGSCAPDGTLRFNWRLIMLRPELMEYVVVHELAHLTHPNHSKHFWALVSEVLSDAPQRRLRLREEGRTPPL